MIPLTRSTAGPRFIGVIHLLPLPGAPRSGPGIAAVESRALADARALREGGVDAIIVENLGDAPFAGEDVEPITTACMTRIAWALRREAPDIQLGINVLRNDAAAALSIAAAVEADFIRVNVHIGAMVTDQGPLYGRARETLLLRQRLRPVAIAADVLVKHAVPLGDPAIEDIARDTAYRGGADALIVSGRGTGLPTALDDVLHVRDATPNTPLWIGSGVTPETAGTLSAHVDAMIVGTFLHHSSDLDLPVDVDRVREMNRALRG